MSKSRKQNNSHGSSAENFLQQRRRQPPRVKVQGRIGQNTYVRGMEVCNSIATNADGNGSLVVPLIGGAVTGLNTNFSPLQQVARIYNQFLFTSSSMRYIPSVGMTTPGNVTVTFLNNSESCYYALEAGRTWSELAGLALGQANAVTHPVWHEFSYPMNLPARRKRFEVNNTGATSSNDTVERDCQGVFIIIVSGSTASTLISTPRRESVLMLEGLSTAIP